MQRPTSVTVFGVLNIVFGALGFFAMMFTVIVFILPLPTANNPVLEIMRNSPGYAVWMKLAIPLGFLATGVSIAAGAGLLKLKSSARCSITLSSCSRWWSKPRRNRGRKPPY